MSLRRDKWIRSCFTLAAGCTVQTSIACGAAEEKKFCVIDVLEVSTGIRGSSRGSLTIRLRRPFPEADLELNLEQLEELDDKLCNSPLFYSLLAHGVENRGHYTLGFRYRTGESFSNAAMKRIKFILEAVGAKKGESLEMDDCSLSLIWYRRKWMTWMDYELVMNNLKEFEEVSDQSRLVFGEG